MIDSKLINMASAGAVPNSRQPSSKELNYESSQESAFAMALAQSTNKAEELKQKTGHDTLSQPSDQVTEEEESTISLVPEVTNVVDIAALVAQMMAEGKTVAGSAANTAPTLDGAGEAGAAVAVGVKFAGGKNAENRDVQMASIDNSTSTSGESVTVSNQLFAKPSAAPAIMSAGTASNRKSVDINLLNNSVPAQPAQLGLQGVHEKQLDIAGLSDASKNSEGSRIATPAPDFSSNVANGSGNAIPSPVVPSFGGAIKADTVFLIPTHVDSSSWSKDFGEHVIRLAIKGEPSAEIHLNPPDLGPIRVSIEMDGTDASLRFLADRPHTREALEVALPRLREIFAENSLSLSDVNVSDQSFSQRDAESRQQNSGGKEQNSGRHVVIGVEDATLAPKVTNRALGRSQVDLFA